MAARFLVPSLLALSLTACGGVDPTLELELARSEARYLPLEVGATTALGVFKASVFAELSASIQADGSTAGYETDPPCVGIDLLDPMGADDLSGAVRYDFTRCGSAGGALQVDQRVLLPELPTDERDVPQGDWPEDWDGDWPEDWDGELPTGDDLEDLLLGGGSANMAVGFDSFSEGILGMDGSLALDGGVDGGALSVDLSVSALDYGGDLVAQGAWAPGATASEQQFQFAGTFTSSAGLDWTVQADGIQLDAECGDARGGELRATFTNDAGRVELRAVFSPTCDGCAEVFINGVSEGETCLDTASFY